MDVRDDIFAVMRVASRKLRAARAIEAAAVGAVAGGLCAAVAEVAWTLAGASAVVAGAVCAACVAFAALLTARPGLRRILSLDPRASRLVGGICAVCGVGALACVATGWYATVPVLLLPLLLMPGGAVAGLIFAARSTIALPETALYHDVRLGLAERLSTAVELAASDAADEPFSRCVYADALAAARASRPERQPVWRRTRATGGAVGLSVALCAALAFLPSPGATDVPRSFERIRSRAANLTEPGRRNLAKVLRRLAEEVRQNAKLREALRAAAAAKADELPEKLQELEAVVAGADAAEAARIAREILRAIGAGDGEGGPSGGDANAPGAAGSDPIGEAPPDPNTFRGPDGSKSLLARAYVYHPAYGSVRDANGLPASRPSGNGGGFVPRRDAWSEARQRAARALARGRVPAEYRRLVRRFFEVE